MLFLQCQCKIKLCKKEELDMEFFCESWEELGRSLGTIIAKE
jgi:hypothetical protein